MTRWLEREWPDMEKVRQGGSSNSVIQNPFQKILEEKKRRGQKRIKLWGSLPQNNGWVGDGSTMNWWRTESMWFRSVDDREIGRMWRAMPCQGKLAEGGSKAKLYPKHKETGSQHPQWQQWKRYRSLEECQHTSEELPKSILFSLPADSFCNSLFWR